MEFTVEDDKAKIWRERVGARHAGGQSVRAWWLANGVREHSFYRWRARLGLSPAGRISRRQSNPVAFARFLVQPSALKVDGCKGFDTRSGHRAG